MSLGVQKTFLLFRDFTPLNKCKRLNVFGMDNFSGNNVDVWPYLAATAATRFVLFAAC